MFFVLWQSLLFTIHNTEDAAYHLHIRQKWVSKNLVGIVLVYSLPYIANTVLRNATGHGRGERDMSGINRLI